jgi:hypothetical protein
MVRDIDFDGIQKITDIRFPSARFRISCFDSIQEIADKAVTSFSDAIVIAYYHERQDFDNLNITLQDIDYIPVIRRRDEDCIYLSTVIDAVIAYELSGAIKPIRYKFFEGIQLLDSGSARVPIYKIQWGT